MHLDQTVLLVDDDEHLLASLRRALRAEPYTLVVAASPAEALGLLASRPVDVVLTDQRMPGMSGAEFLARVRAQYPHVISIMLTGHADLATAISAINAGEVYRLFTKPCDVGTLAVAIRQALQHRALVHQARRLLDTLRRETTAPPAGLALGGVSGDAALDGDAWRVPPEPVVYEVHDADERVDLDALLREIEAELEDADRRHGVRPPSERPPAGRARP
jgi:two-component system, probable response regulator PhcQ